MALSAGTRVGPYEILGLIGAGGMGEVYKAKDTRLDRTVAIKVLPPHLADPEHRARFEREAKTIAGLSHPHICPLYDVGEHGSSLFLVMEHLEGGTLAERLRNGALPVPEALEIGTQTAEALSAAHRAGFIHRDLKPGNIMLTKSGVKLLDFGLAKLKAPAAQQAFTSAEPTQTRSEPLTGRGTILGTLQYMAPEQLEGKEADARTDIWALGLVLYETVTGRRAFEATSEVSLMGAILEREPAPLSSLQPLTPQGLDRIVRQCLAKSPDARPDTAHDLANDLRWIRETYGAERTGVRSTHSPRERIALLIVVGLLLCVAGLGAMWLLRPSPPRALLAGLSLNVRPAEEVNAGGVYSIFVSTPGGSRTALTWTPDGQALVFVGRRGGVQQLYVRRLDVAEARPLPNTEGAQVPAVSADGQWVAFWANGMIRKVPLGGGPVMDIASGPAGPPWGLVWDTHGRVFFGSGDDGRVWAIPPEGAPAAVTTVGEAEVRHTLPWPLPGERALLYTVRKRWLSWGDEDVVAQTLATGARKVLLKDAADARYVPTGHLVFLRRGVLFTVPFDAERLQVHGTPVAVLDTVAQALTAGNPLDVTGAGQFAVATTGTLAWVPGPVLPYPDATLVTVDRRGQVAPLPAPVRSYGPMVRVSPDGRRLAVIITTHTEVGLWVYDLHRGTLTPLAATGEVGFPIWSPDGRRLVFGWLAGGRRSLAAQPADGTAPPQTLIAGEIYPSSFTRDGRQVAAVRDSWDIAMVTVEPGQARAQPVTQTPQSEGWPEFSPDGRWLAYGSDVSGRFEVYVRPYPGAGATEAVSLEGGGSPAWHPSGRELFFPTLPDPAGKGRMMVADFAPGSPPRIGRPRALFEFEYSDLLFGCTQVRCFEVAPDGQRFYAVQWRTPPPQPAVMHINLIQNWFEELKAKVPGK